MTRRTWIAAIGALLALGAFALWGNDRPLSPPGLVGDLWQIEQEGGSSLCFVTGEARVRSGPRPSAQLDYTRYRLVRQDIASGEVVRSVVLGDRARGDDVPQIIGVVRDELWISDERIEVRDAKTLERRADSEVFRAENPEIAELIPDDGSLYTTASAFDSMTFKALDARHYRIQGPSWRAESIEQDLKDMGVDKVFFGASSLLTPLPARALRSRFLCNSDVVIPGADGRRDAAVGEGIWYALLADRDREILDQWAGEPHEVSGDARRALYLAPCVRRIKGKDAGGATRFETELDREGLVPIGEQSFLYGGLLVSPRQGAAWRTEDPTSYLVMSKRTIAKGDSWLVQRVSVDGAIQWTADTGMWELSHVIDAREFVVFGGRAGEGDRGTSTYLLISVAIDDGTVRIFDIATGETRTP